VKTAPLIACIAVVTLLGSMEGSGNAAVLASPAPQRLVLRLLDLPTGFTIERKETGSRSNAAVAREDDRLKQLPLLQGAFTLADLVRLGRIGGYQATFARAPTLRGLFAGALEVQSFASVYRTTRGAAASFAQTRFACRRSTFKPLSIGTRLGHEAVLCSTVRQSSGQKIAVYALGWRRANVIASILVAGIAGVADPTEAVRLGRKQDTRIAQQLR
jgi:hypothetical protein